MMRNFARYCRGGWNLFRFAIGARDYHWALSPLQQVVNYLASLASRQTDSAGWQKVAVFAYALLKYRENHYFDGMNFVARQRGPLTQANLRNFVLWQDRMIRNQALPPGFRFNAALVVSDGADLQTDRLFSALCLSDTVNGFSIFWDEAEADRAFRAPLGLTEGESRRWRAGEDVFDLAMDLGGRGGGAPLAALRAAEREGVPRAFRPSLDPRRLVTHYIKVAHPHGFRLAVSLPEDADGFADASLQTWLPHLERLAAAQDQVTICLLNRFVTGQDSPTRWPRGVHPVRQGGLAEQDVAAFAMEAELFFGCLDIYGLAARSAGLPGIYIGMDDDEAGRQATLVPDPAAPELFAALRAWWREVEELGLARLMQPQRTVPTEDGPAAANAAGFAVAEAGGAADMPAGVMEGGASSKGCEPDRVGSGGRATASSMPGVGRGPA